MVSVVAEMKLICDRVVRSGVVPGRGGALAGGSNV